MRRSSTYVDDFRDHVGGRSARSALTGAISIAIVFAMPPSSFVQCCPCPDRAVNPHLAAQGDGPV
jgi:hypothetical protein